MEIQIETKSYNEKRYGKPWIAKVSFEDSKKGDFIWGDWTGDHYNGGEGVLSLDANIGNIVARGQKDNRQPRNSAPDFYVVSADGTLDKIGDKGAAYKHYLAQKNNEPDINTLRLEKERLIARIAEIDNIINA